MIKKCAECGKINSVIRRSEKYMCVACNSNKEPLIEKITEDEVELANIELLKENVKLAKQKQKFQDKNRVSNNTFRKDSRIENSFEDYSEAIYKLLSERNFPVRKSAFPKSENGRAIIVHLTDTHFNELVLLRSNKYDFKIASKRLFKFAERVIKYAEVHGVNEIYLMMTGDMINSDRRLDELLSMAANRAKATILAVELLYQFIAHLTTVANVKVFSVSGNESRIREEYTTSRKLTTDNFDFMIYEILKLCLKDDPTVNFISGDRAETVISINGKNFLLCHGNFLKKMAAKDVAQVIARYVNEDVKINYIICGHLHETKIKDSLLRGGSLVGSNDYTEKGLNLYGKASQNLHIVYKNGDVDSVRVDLQEVSDEYNRMYDIDEKLEAYNAKSLDKTKEKTIIFQTVI